MTKLFSRSTSIRTRIETELGRSQLRFPASISRSTSIRTRIETLLCGQTEKAHYFSLVVLPLEQGLKRYGSYYVLGLFTESLVVLPLEQGLKLTSKSLPSSVKPSSLVVLPLEQGLKPPFQFSAVYILALSLVVLPLEQGLKHYQWVAVTEAQIRLSRSTSIRTRIETGLYAQHWRGWRDLS